MKLKLKMFKNNYIVSSLKQRPILFLITAVFSSILTYNLTSTSLVTKYKKILVAKDATIEKLEFNSYLSKDKAVSKNTVIVEEFNKDTGKLIKKISKSAIEKKLNKLVSKELTKTKLVESVKIDVVEKEIRMKNLFLIGVDLDWKLDKRMNFSYYRKFGKFNVGGNIVVSPSIDVDEYNFGVSIGLDF